MIHAFIGLIVGSVMGITGAGGAFIAIPLFQLLLDASLKEATVLSLITVLLGTGVNLIGRTAAVKWKIVLGFAFFGTLANYLSLPLKSLAPDLFIALLLFSIGIYSIRSVWQPPLSSSKSSEEVGFVKVAFIGLILGLVTTLTGLGGGVMLIPILLRIFGMNYEQALPTSLSTIMFIAFSSLAFQGTKTMELISSLEIFYIGAGAMIAFGALKLLLKTIDEIKTLKLRKFVFTLATLGSLVVVMIKTFF